MKPQAWVRFTSHFAAQHSQAQDGFLLTGSVAC